MSWQYNHYVLALAIAAATAATIALLAWRRRPAPGAAVLALLLLAGSEWTLMYAVEIGTLDPPTKVFLSRVMYIGVVCVPTMWFVLTAQYTGREKWLTRRNLALLAIMPLCTLLLTWTERRNDGHGLIWRQVSFDTSVSPVRWEITYGPFFWVHTAYSYLLVLSGSILIFQVLIRSPRLYRGQTSALLVAALTPLAGNVLYLSGLNPFPALDLTPLAFNVTGLAMAWALYRFRLLDIVPVAHEAVIKSMSDGIMVLDMQHRIVDLNPAAAQIISRPAAEVTGQSADQALFAPAGVAERYRDVMEAQAEIVLGEGKAQRNYDLRISALLDRYERPTGRLVLLRDVTERVRAQTALQRRAVQLQAAAEVGRTATSILEPERLIQRAVDLIQARFNFYYVGLFLVDPSGEWAILRAGSGEAGRAMLARGHQIRIGAGITGWSIANGQVRVAHDVGDEVAPELPGTRSEAALPLRSRGQVRGALTVQSERPEVFDEATLAVLQTIADQVAVALDNAQLIAQTREALEAERRAYGEASRQAWEQMLRARPDLGYLYRRGGTTSQVAGQWQPEMIQAHQDGQTVWNGGPEVYIPIKVRDQVLGVARLCKPDDAEAWTAEEIALMEALTGQLNEALENARLYQDTQRRAVRGRMVGEITAHMRETLDVDTVLKTAAREMRETLGLTEAEVRIGIGPALDETGANAEPGRRP